MDVLTVKGLTKRYPKFTLEGASFSVRAGEIMGFIGRNGAGKTTTLKSLFGLVHPDAGDLTFFGLPFRDNETKIKCRVGFVTGGVDYYLRKRLRAITAITRSFYPDWDEKAYRNYIETFSLD